MAAYTVVQLFEILLFAAVLLYGLLGHRPSVAALGGGLLMGKAILNILAVEGGTIYRRSVIGYGLGAVFVAVAILVVKLGA